MHWIDCNRRPDQRQCLRLPPEPQTGTAISVPTEELKIEDAPASCFYFYQDCGSSGMDDSPRTPRHPAAGRFYDWIDLSCQMVLSGRMLSRMHQVENNLAAARQWQDRAEKLTREINRELWCDKTGFYHDRMLGANFVPSKTAAGFWAILAGVCDLKQQQILEEHLQNPATFGRPVPVPSLSADDLNYCPDGTYWLGGVWAPTNYMIIRGLMRSGSGDLAHQLARKYLDALAEVYNKYQPHSLWECYCSETPLPGRRPYCRREFVKPDFVGWTGIGPVSMLIENILGIDLQAPARHINWDLRLPGDHGLDNLYVQGEPVSLRCQVGNGKPTITVKARTDLTLQVRHQDKTTKLQVRPGPEQCWDLN